MKAKQLYGIIFLPLLSLYADTCYSDELWSVKAENFIPVDTEKECQNLHIGSYIANRCGCFKDFTKAKEKLQKYKLLYPNAYVTKTRKERFQTLTISKPIVKEVKEDVAKSVDINTTFRFKAIQNDTKNPLETFEDTQKLAQSNANLNTAFNENSAFYGLSLEGKYEQYLNQDYAM